MHTHQLVDSCTAYPVSGYHYLLTWRGYITRTGGPPDILSSWPLPDACQLKDAGVPRVQTGVGVVVLDGQDG